MIPLALALAALPGAAAERAAITTDGIMAYRDGAWIAVGGVRLVQGDLEVRADRMRYEIETERAEFSGNVRIRRSGESLDAQAFTYDLKEQTGRIVEGLAAFEIEATSDPLYILGDEILVGADKIEVYGARLTTCEPPDRAGYYLIGQRMDIFPGERVVIRSVRFVESNVTLFYWPYLSISLTGRQRVRIPEVGHNATDGWYVKTRYDYDGPGSGRGEAALDVYQYRGIGTGVHHIYRESPAGEGSLTVYRVHGWGGEGEELRLAWEESFSLGGDLQVDWKSAYLRNNLGGGEPEREGSFALSLAHERGSASSWLDLERQVYWDVDPGRVDTLWLRHRSRPWGWSWRLDVDARSERRAGSDARDAVAYLSTLRRSIGAYTLQLDAETRIHPSWFTGGSVAPTWRSRSRLPEASFSVDIDRLLPLRAPLTVTLSAARLAEERRVFGDYERVEADRAGVAFSLRPVAFRLGALGRVQSRGSVTWHAYSGGERRWLLSADHQYLLPLTRRLSFSASYWYRQPLGDAPPLQADTIAYEERVTGRLQYTYGAGSVSLWSGYDFASGLTSDVIAQATYSRSGLFATVQAGYSPSDGAMSFAAASLSLRRGERVELRAATRYDFFTQSIDSLSASLALSFPGWRFLYETAYDGYDGAWSTGEAAIIRDLGCREIGLRFDGWEGSVWLEYRINAFPGDGIRLGARDDRFDFDPTGILSLF